MFYRGSIPPPLTITPKFNYMEKELLTLYDYNKARYMAVDVDHERIGSKEITIL